MDVLLYGGLNQVTFLLLFFFVGVGVLWLVYIRFSVNPLDFRDFSYGGLASSNASLLHEISDILRLMAAGSCLIMAGGWLVFVLMCNGSAFHFL